MKKGVPAQHNFTAEAIQEVVSGRSNSNQNSRLLNYVMNNTT